MEKTTFVSRVRAVLAKKGVPSKISYGEEVMEDLLNLGFLEKPEDISQRRLFLQLCLLVAQQLEKKRKKGDRGILKGGYPTRDIFDRFGIADESDKQIHEHWGIFRIVVVVDPECPAIVSVRRSLSSNTTVAVQLGSLRKHFKMKHKREIFENKERENVPTERMPFDFADV